MSDYVKTANRGIVLYFGCTEFDDTNLSARSCAEVSTFQQMRAKGFTVLPVLNATAATIFEFADHYNNSNFEKYESLFLIIASHGTKDDLIYARDNLYDPYNSVLKIFANPTLKDKPKIFLIGCCRGNFVLQDDYFKCGPAPYQTTNTSIPSQFYVNRAYYLDTFIHWSTLPGFASIASKLEGDYFLKAWADELVNSDGNSNLKEMADRVCAAISNFSFEPKTTGDRVVRQIPCYSSTFTRKYLV